jgi:hypothetical protein
VPKGFITTAQAAAQTGMSVRRIQELCKARLVKGAQQFGDAWMVPSSFRWAPRKPGPKSRGKK